MSAGRSALFGKMVEIGMLKRLLMYRESQGKGLYFGQLPILETLRHNDCCTQKELADMLHVSPASVAVSAKRLEKNGLITRRTDENNARCNRLSVTEKGVMESERCRELFDMIDERALEDFSEKEMEMLDSFLSRIIVNLGGESDDVGITRIAKLAEKIADEEKAQQEKESVLENA